jgi:hypothetical protein
VPTERPYPLSFNQGDSREKTDLQPALSGTDEMIRAHSCLQIGASECCATRAGPRAVAAHEMAYAPCSWLNTNPGSGGGVIASQGVD